MSGSTTGDHPADNDDHPTDNDDEHPAENDVSDNGCVVPGCNLPPEFCDAQHLLRWEDGGTTDLDTLALLCSRHHTAHHYGAYPVEMLDSLPWVRLPAWRDIARPWLRNTTHQDLHHTAERIRRRASRRFPVGPV